MNNLFDLGAPVFVSLRNGSLLKTRVTAILADRKGRITYDFVSRGENPWVAEELVAADDPRESAPADAAPALDDPARIDALAEDLTATVAEPAKESLAKKPKAKK